MADLLSRNGRPVRLWLRDEAVCAQINEAHENRRYLPGHALPEGLSATTSFDEAVVEAEAVVVVIPSQAIRGALGPVAERFPEGVPIIAASKGIENDSLMLVAELLTELLPERHHPYLAFLSGPSFAKEVCDQQPTAVTVAAYWPRVAERAQALFTTPYFRAYTSTDVIGVEVGGAMKNVIAIAAGAADGLGFGHNARAALITRGLAEISRLGVALGANPLTFMGLAGMGDLILTCTGGLSRNRRVGVALGEGHTLEHILGELGMVAEGVKTSLSAWQLSQRVGVEMPITEQIFRLLYEDKPARQAVSDLMSRDPRSE